MEENNSENMHTESIAVQKAEWVRQEVERQRRIEDEIREKLVQEQIILEKRAGSIETEMDRTIELRRYNEQRREEINEQVYALYGLSSDKLADMKEYRQGAFRGCAIALFLLSIALTIVCGVLYGPTEKITLLMLVCLGAEGTILPGNGKRNTFLNIICESLYVFIFPLMVALFICNEFQIPEYKWVELGAIGGALVMSLLGTVSYFAYDPYRKERRKVRQAGKDLKNIDEIAQKAVKRNQKIRLKQEKKQRKIDAKQQKKQALLTAKQEKTDARKRAWQEKTDARKRARQAKKELDTIQEQGPANQNISNMMIEQEGNIEQDNLPDNSANTAKRGRGLFRLFTNEGNHAGNAAANLDINTENNEENNEKNNEKNNEENNAENNLENSEEQAEESNNLKEGMYL